MPVTNRPMFRAPLLAALLLALLSPAMHAQSDTVEIAPDTTRAAGDSTRGRYQAGRNDTVARPISDSLLRVQDSTIVAANAVLARDSMSMEAYVALATIYKARRQFRSRLTLAERMIAVNPYSALANFTYGDALLDNEAPEKAVAPLLRALVMEPKFVRARTALADAYAMRRMFDTALAHLDTAILINPRYAQSYLQRAELLNELGRDSAAIADYMEAGELAPEDLEVWMRLVRLQIKTFRDEEAVPVLQYLLSRDTTADVLYLLATAFERTNQLRESVTTYERFILLFPRDRRALDAERAHLRLRGMVSQGKQ